MDKARRPAASPATEQQRTVTHGVPAFWPIAAAAAMGQAGIDLFRRGLDFMVESQKIDHGLKPRFATDNAILLELHTLRLRDFGHSRDGRATLVVAPYAGHSSTIADFRPQQSLVQTLLDAGLPRVLLTDWKSATPEMRDFDIDLYLAELNVCIDELDAPVNLVGLCQGGWMCAMYAARYPERVAALVLAGAPIDTSAGDGPLKAMVERSPMAFYQELVALGGGLMRGQLMLQGWKNMHPGEQYVEKYLRLFENVHDPDYVQKAEAFASWYENPIDMPGRWYLQVIRELFQENRLAQGEFVGLGRQLSLRQIHCPLYLLAGESDDITPHEQVFAAKHLVGTPQQQVIEAVAPGGHIGLFMGSHTLKTHWPRIGAWLRQTE